MPSSGTAKPGVTPITSKSAERLVWVDAVRGFSVLAVVLGHFVVWGLVPGTPAEAFWEKLSGQLTPIRMPTLFVLTGFLLSSRVQAGFSDRRSLTSAATSYYLYAVWLSLFGLTAMVGVSTGVTGISGFMTQLVLPNTVLWFILGLAAWTLVLTTLHRVHPVVILAALGVLSVASYWLPGQSGVDHYARILQYGFFFGLGVHGKPIFAKLASGKLWRVSIGALVGYIIARLIMSTVSNHAVVEATLTIVRDTTAAVVAIVVIAAVCRMRCLRVPLVWVGRRTLPIYVMHAPVIGALTGFAGWDAFVGISGLAWLVPVAGTVVVSAGAVGVHAVLIRTPLRTLFQLPSGLRRRLEGRPAVPRADGVNTRHR